MLGNILVGWAEQKLFPALPGNGQARRCKVALRIFDAADDLLDRSSGLVLDCKIHRCGKGFNHVVFRAALLAVAIDVQTGGRVAGQHDQLAGFLNLLETARRLLCLVANLVAGSKQQDKAGKAGEFVQKEG